MEILQSFNLLKFERYLPLEKILKSFMFNNITTESKLQLCLTTHFDDC